MSFTYWTVEKQQLFLSVSPACNLEDLIETYPDIEPVRPKFVRKGAQIALPRAFHEAFATVAAFYGWDTNDINEHKEFVRSYPDLAAPRFIALAQDIRTRPEFGANQRINAQEKHDAKVI